jgi:hypothetical protein
MIDVSKFFKEHVCLCICTFGTAIVGYLGYHAVRWLINKCKKTEKIDQIAQKSFALLEEKSSSPSKDIIENNPLKDLDERKKFAAVQIQRAYRRYLARPEIKTLKIKKLEEETLKAALKRQSRAAVKIQVIWKDYARRIKTSLLSYSLLEQAKPYIDDPSKLAKVKRASSGSIPVYLLPKELPIVLKETQAPANRTRFKHMQQARHICETNGYKDLVIPKGGLYRNFIIESWQPIIADGTKEQIGLYIENRGRFRNAVKEFTGFLCQCSFDDITGGTNDAYGTLGQTPLGRYDNIPLYLDPETGEGKIGLIDLEKFSPEPRKWEGCFSSCRDAVHLFPYHLDEIISAAQKFDDNAEKYRKKLEIEQKETLKRFELTYENHLKFIQEKGITLAKPCEIVELTLGRKKEIETTIVEFLSKDQPQDYWYKGHLGEDPEKTINCVASAFEEILNTITSLLSETLKLKMQRTNTVISSNWQLLCLRTLYPGSRLRKAIKSQLPKIELASDMHRDWGEECFASLIIKKIFEELAKGREIAYYNHAFGYGSYAKECIFL